jgi:hypothetical protein
MSTNVVLLAGNTLWGVGVPWSVIRALLATECADERVLRARAGRGYWELLSRSS